MPMEANWIKKAESLYEFVNNGKLLELIIR